MVKGERKDVKGFGGVGSGRKGEKGGGLLWLAALPRPPGLILSDRRGGKRRGKGRKMKRKKRSRLRGEELEGDGST